MNYIHELSRAECLDLLRSAYVGRIALTTPVGPYVAPVGYVVLDDGIVFRTSPYSLLGSQAHGAMVAFEVDHVPSPHVPWSGAELPLSWSVVVRGRAEGITAASDLDRIGRSWSSPVWSADPRSLHLRVPLSEVSGRRLGNRSDTNGGGQSSAGA